MGRFVKDCFENWILVCSGGVMENTSSEPLRLRIDRIAYRGPGIAHAPDGAVCFVPGTCPGELVEAQVVEERKNFRKARVLRVLEPSPDRLAEPDCRVAAPDGGPAVQVPGCVYDHVRHETEVEWKVAQLREFLERQAGIPGAGAKMEEPFVSPKALHYRNKCVLHSARDAAGKQILGYVGEDNVTVVDIPSCPLSDEAIDEELAGIRADPAFWRYVGAGSEVVLRHPAEGGVAVWADRPGDRPGERDRLPDLAERTPVLGSMRVPARGFWQMNGEVGGALVSAVTDLLRAEAPARFVDLYCGVGVFGLSAAKGADVPRVVGADSGRDVVRAANGNARHFALDGRARFDCADVAKAARHLLAENAGPGAAVLVDPPRAGLDPRVAESLLALPSRLLLYVSCAPDTLARDLRLLCAPGGYALRSARLFDMFPRTAHFETLCVLEKPLLRKAP